MTDQLSDKEGDMLMNEYFHRMWIVGSNWCIRHW